MVLTYNFKKYYNILKYIVYISYHFTNLRSVSKWCSSPVASLRDVYIVLEKYHHDEGRLLASYPYIEYIDESSCARPAEIAALVCSDDDPDSLRNPLYT